MTSAHGLHTYVHMCTCTPTHTLMCIHTNLHAHECHIGVFNSSACSVANHPFVCLHARDGDRLRVSKTGLAPLGTAAVREKQVSSANLGIRGESFLSGI